MPLKPYFSAGCVPLWLCLELGLFLSMLIDLQTRKSIIFHVYILSNVTTEENTKLDKFLTVMMKDIYWLCVPVRTLCDVNCNFLHGFK